MRYIGSPYIPTIGGGGIAPKNPTTLANISADWNAEVLASLTQDDAGVTPVTDGSVVGRWADQTGNAHHATQATAGNKPLYVATGFQSRPCVRFDGTDDYLSANTLAAVFTGAGNQPQTVIAVVSLSALGGTRSVLGLGRAASAIPFDVNRINSGNRLEHSRRNDANANIANADVVLALTAGTPVILTYRSDGANADAFNRGGRAYAPQAVQTGTITLDKCAIGALDRTTAANFWIGDIARLIVVNRSISEIERRGVVAYLRAFYRIGT